MVHRHVATESLSRRMLDARFAVPLDERRSWSRTATTEVRYQVLITTRFEEALSVSTTVVVLLQVSVVAHYCTPDALLFYSRYDGTYNSTTDLLLTVVKYY